MKLTIAGVDRSTAYTPQELEEIELVLLAEDGELGLGSVPVPTDDPAEEAASGQQFLAEIGAVTILDGFVGPVARDRGPAVAGTRQTLRYTVVDENAFLSGHRAVLWKRPEETDRDRILAAIDKYLGHLSLDTSMVLNTNNETIPKKTYTTEDVFQELQDDCGNPTAKLMFIENRRFHWHRQHEGDAAGLEVVATGADRATTFQLESATSPQRSKDGMDLITDVLARNPTSGVSYQTDDATSQALHDADGLRHQRLIEQDGASLAQLTTLANRMLATYKNERITYEGTIGPLTAAQVALIPPGSLITVTDPVWGLTSSVQRIAGLRLSYRHPNRFMAGLQLGYVPRLRTKPIKDSSTSSAGTGQDTGAGPCGGCPPYLPYTCATCTANDQDDSNRHGTTGTSWKLSTIFQRTSQVTVDGGDVVTGDAYGEVTSGPSFTRMAVSDPGAVWSSVGTFFQRTGFPGDPWDLIDRQDRVFLSFPVWASAAAIHVVGDLYLDTNWSGSFQTEGRALLPATRFQLIAVEYETDLLSALNGGGLAALDLDAYPQQVILDAIHPGGYGVPFHIDAAIPFDPTGLGWVAIFLRNLATKTIAVTNRGGSPADEVLVIDRYPAYPPERTSASSFGHQVRMPSYALDFCTCTVGSDTVPTSGQTIHNEIGGVGDGSTTTFFTHNPFMAGSLLVRINGIDVTDAVSSVDPATGRVTFSPAPGIGSEITWSYRVA